MKTFDCVEMKRKGAERVRRETAGMSKEEVLAYWQRGIEELREEQTTLQKKARVSAAPEEPPEDECQVLHVDPLQVNKRP